MGEAVLLSLKLDEAEYLFRVINQCGYMTRSNIMELKLWVCNSLAIIFGRSGTEQILRGADFDDIRPYQGTSSKRRSSRIHNLSLTFDDNYNNNNMNINNSSMNKTSSQDDIFAGFNW